MIVPTPGRVVWFTPPANNHFQWDQTQPLSASVAYVHNERCINIGFLDQAGIAHSATSVPLLQDDDVPPAGGNFCQWMPYQKGQAAKAEKLEQQLATGVP